MSTRACRAEAQRRRVTALLRNAHGVADWNLFVQESNKSKPETGERK